MNNNPVQTVAIAVVAVVTMISVSQCTLESGKSRREAIVKLAAYDTPTSRVAICSIGDVTETYCVAVAVRQAP